MPICSEPGELFAIVLETDLTKPKDKRPTFWVKAVSMRDYPKYAAKIDEAIQKPTVDEIFSANIELLFELVAKCDNFGGPFDRDGVLDKMTFQEVREILNKTLRNQHLGPDEKKG